MQSVQYWSFFKSQGSFLCNQNGQPQADLFQVNAGRLLDQSRCTITLMFFHWICNPKSCLHTKFHIDTMIQTDFKAYQIFVTKCPICRRMPDVSVNAQLILRIPSWIYPIILHHSKISSAAYCQQPLNHQLAA